MMVISNMCHQTSTKCNCHYCHIFQSTEVINNYLLLFIMAPASSANQRQNSSTSRLKKKRRVRKHWIHHFRIIEKYVKHYKNTQVPRDYTTVEAATLRVIKSGKWLANQRAQVAKTMKKGGGTRKLFSTQKIEMIEKFKRQLGSLLKKRQETIYMMTSWHRFNHCVCFEIHTTISIFLPHMSCMNFVQE